MKTVLFNPNEINENKVIIKKNAWKAIALINNYDTIRLTSKNKLENCELYLNNNKLNLISKEFLLENYLAKKTLLINKNVSNHLKVAESLIEYFKKNILNTFSIDLECDLVSTNSLNGCFISNQTNSNKSFHVVFKGSGSFVSDNNEYFFQAGDILFLPNNINYSILTNSQSIILQINFKNTDSVNKSVKSFSVKEISKAFVDLGNLKILETSDSYFDYVKIISKKKEKDLTINDIILLIKGYEQAGFFEKALDIIEKHNLSSKLPAFLIYSLKTSSEHISKSNNIKLLSKCIKQDKELISDTLLYESYLSASIANRLFDVTDKLLDYADLKGNWNFTKTKNLYLELNLGDIKQEVGVPFVHLALMTYLIEKFDIQNIYVKVRSDFQEFYKKYFPKIKVIPESTNLKSQMPWTSCYTARMYLHKQNDYKKILLDQIEKNRQIVLPNINLKSKKIGILWFSNDIKRNEKGIPIGVLINTIGNTDKLIEIKSLQYNYPKTEINLFNNYSKNKITDIFDNDLSATVQELVEATFDCKAIIGTSNVTLIASAFGIPTLLVTGYTTHHWYVNEEIIPGIEYTKMRYRGDWKAVDDKINSFVDNHFD